MVKTSHRGVKTTVEIPEDLWRKAKLRAIDEPGGMRGVIVHALRELLGDGDSKPKGGSRGKR